MKGIKYLHKKLEDKRRRCKLRYKYYEQKAVAPDLGISTPEGLEWLSTVNGWCTKAVDNLADRLQFDKFENDNFNFQAMFDQNNPDIFYDDAILSALITSCSFALVTKGEVINDEQHVRFQVIDGSNATGIIDDYTKLLVEGYAVLERDEHEDPIRWAYCTPGRTEIYEKGNDKPIAVETFNSPKYCSLVPIIYRPDAKRLFGHSRISRACMDYAKSAMRTVKRMEISSEFYSYPQKYVTGLSQDAEKMDKWKATISAMLSFTKDEDGDKPTIGQFQVGSMAPHVEALKSIASMFAGETGLTLDDLGFVTSNPSSAEAIKAGHEGLRLTASKAQKCFSVGFKNVGYIGAIIRDDFPYQREEVFETIATWRPTFEPDAQMLSAIGDGVLKINQALENGGSYIDEDRMRRLTGIE
ncbi:MAG: phage portal protein [Bacteroidales bacterium]|nr:phage portal protein [Bacteroidales bacterium]